MRCAGSYRRTSRQRRRHSRRRFRNASRGTRWLAGVAAAGALLAGCGPAGTSSGTATPPPQPPPSPGPASVLWQKHAHGGPIAGLSVNADDTLVTVADNDSPLHLFDAATGTQVAGISMGVHPGAQAVAFSPTGTEVAVGTFHGILVFDTSTGQQTLTLSHGTDSSVDALAWSPDGTYLAAGHRPGGGGSGDIGFSIFDASTGKEVYNYSTTGWIDALAWTTDGTHLAAGTKASLGSGALEIVDATTLTHERTIATSVDSHGLTWQNSTGTFWSTDGQTVHRWTPSTGADAPLSLPGVTVLAAAPSGSDVAAGYTDGTVALLNANGSSSTVLTKHAKGVTDLAWAPDGSTLYSSDGAGIVTRSRISGKSNTSYRIGRGRAYAVAWSPDDREVASGGDDGAVRIWDAKTGDLLVQRYVVPTPYGIDAMAWKPDGTSIAIMGANKVELLDPSSLAVESSFDYPVFYADTDMAWSHDGTKLALAGSIYNVNVWDSTTSTLTKLPLSSNAVAWGPKDRQVVVGGKLTAQPTTIVGLATNQETPLVSAFVIVQAVAWGAHGVAVGLDGAVDVVDPATQAVTNTIDLGANGPPRTFAVRWQPGGSLLAIAGDYAGALKCSVCLWDAATNTTYPLLAGSAVQGTAGAVAWSHDGKELAATDWEGNLAVTDAIP